MTKFRPSPALIVAFIALFVAMGGVGYSAIKLKKNAVKTKNIKNGAVTTPKLAADVKAPTAAKADDALKLGGKSAAEYQGFCQPGAIKGTFVSGILDATTPAAYTNVVGFNCGQPGNTTTSVQIKRNGLGDYNVKFLGGAGGSGSAVVSRQTLAGGTVNAEGTGVAGEFHVQSTSEPVKITLLAF